MFEVMDPKASKITCETLGLPSGNDSTACELENGPVEIASCPTHSIVMFHSFPIKNGDLNRSFRINKIVIFHCKLLVITRGFKHH